MNDFERLMAAWRQGPQAFKKVLGEIKQAEAEQRRADLADLDLSRVSPPGWSPADPMLDDDYRRYVYNVNLRRV